MTMTQLGTDHPELLLQLPDNPNQDILRCRIEVGETIHPDADALVRVGEPAGELAHHLVILDGAPLDRNDIPPGHDRFGLAVGPISDRCRTFGDGIRKLSPGVDQFVELQVQWPEHGTDHGPVKLLAHQRKVEKLSQCGLELPPNLVVGVPAKRRKMREA